MGKLLGICMLALVLAPIGGAASSQRSQTWPGGCHLRPSSIANPPATNQALWTSAAAYLAGQPEAYWFVPQGCVWLSYPPETTAQRQAPLPGASSIPELRIKIRGKVHTTELPVPARAVGLAGPRNWDAQTFTVAWPYVHFTACEYEGTQQTTSGIKSVYAHYTTWTYNARGVGHWDAATDDSHPCP